MGWFPPLPSIFGYAPVWLYLKFGSIWYHYFNWFSVSICWMYFEAFYSVDDSQAVNTLDYCPTQLFTVVEIFIRLSLEVKVFNLFILQQWRLTILIIRGKINYCRRKFYNFDTDSIRILLMRFYLFFSRSCFSSLIISVLIGYFNSGPHVGIFF
jgi:hypothetical protein